MILEIIDQMTLEADPGPIGIQSSSNKSKIGVSVSAASNFDFGSFRLSRTLTWLGSLASVAFLVPSIVLMGMTFIGMPPLFGQLAT